MDVAGCSYRGEERFFELVDLGGLPPAESLAQVSGMPGADPPYATDLIRRFEEAWKTPFRDLSCEQARLLIGQKMGLQWLGRPAIAFAAHCPAAAVTNYPGEMVLLCLRAADELAKLAEPEFGNWLAGDFSWMDGLFGWSRPLLAEAKRALAAARAH